MNLDERDIALALENRTRQLWAEKHLEMPLSEDEKSWSKWYAFLHEETEDSLKISWPKAIDMTPASPEEPFSQEYQDRLKDALGTGEHLIGAHYACQNACVRIPLSRHFVNTSAMEVYVLGLHPTKPYAKKEVLEQFLSAKSGCVSSAVEAQGLMVGSLKTLVPEVCSLSNHVPLQAFLSTAIPVAERGNDGRGLLVNEIEKANEALNDSLNPPGEGCFFEPLDAALLPQGNLPRYLAAETASMEFQTFNDLEQKVADTGGTQTGELPEVCLLRGMEAVARVSQPALVKNKPILVCSVAAIPLLSCQNDRPGVPIAAVFSWKEDGKLKTEGFHLGDVLSVSKRLVKFRQRVEAGEFNKSYIIATDPLSQKFVGRFHSGLGDSCFSRQLAVAPIGVYFNPAQAGASLEAQAAVFGLSLEPAKLKDDPQVMLRLARAIKQHSSSPSIDNNPQVKGILKELGDQGRAVLDISKAIMERCQAAQSLEAEQYEEKPHVGGVLPQRWLLFPAGELARRITETRQEPVTARQALTKAPEQGDLF